ncbi:MAG TPA: hypothetical protein VL460_03145 [Caulobacteraceae bacterium]|jgi:hypothetical protein|nr:hypothetical protein [Caulobacteraceae bacterium]
MVHHVYNVVRHQDGWAVEHMGKVLDVHVTHEAAEAHVAGLAKLTQSGGHDAEVVIEAEGGGVQSDQTFKRVRR